MQMYNDIYILTAWELTILLAHNDPKQAMKFGSIEKQRMDEMNLVIINFISKLWSPRMELL
jgi:hypothetical protein